MAQSRRGEEGRGVGEKEKMKALQSKPLLTKSKHFRVEQTGYSLPVKTCDHLSVSTSGA